MADPSHIELVRNGIAAVDSFQKERQGFLPFLRHPELNEEDFADFFDQAYERFEGALYLDLTGANLAEMDLRGFNFESADLTGANLRCTNLSNANLNSARLDQTDLTQAVLTRALMSNATLVGSNLSDSLLTRVLAPSANFGRACLFGCDLSYSYCPEADFSMSDLRGAKFRSANLVDAAFNAAELGEPWRIRQNTRVQGLADELAERGLSENEVEYWNAIDHERSDDDAGMQDARLNGANLSGANLIGWNFSGASLQKADLSGADLRAATFRGADLSGARLQDADLRMADLIGCNLTEATLSGADVSQAFLGRTVLASLDLSRVRNLDLVRHGWPSSLGADTLYLSGGRLPVAFLRGCGIPETMIEFLPSMMSVGIEFYSAFISYSHADEDFARRLYARMQQEHLRVWYAPDDLHGGKKLHESIFDAIRLHDKLLVVLSEHSMNSEWVRTEIRRARKREREEGRQVLFPIRLCPFQQIQGWEAFDADSGKDLAVELREYYIPDFSSWKDRDAFEREFTKKLLPGLKQPREFPKQSEGTA